MADRQMRAGYAQALADYGDENPNVIVLDVDTASSTLSGLFAKRYPDRFYNIGIAEPCMVDVGVGFALGGYLPFINGFSALLSLRAIEAIRTNVCYAKTNVKIAASYAGLSDYKDGPTHHSLTDIAMLRALPEMTLIVPADADEAAAFVPLMAAWDGPVTLRINRSKTIPVPKPDQPLEIGRGIQQKAGDDVTLIACGSMVGRCLRAADRLETLNIHARVIEIHTIKPLDTDLICQAAAETGAVITAEEHSIIGGLGGAVAETLAENQPTPMSRIGVRDIFARTAPDPVSLMDAYGLAIPDIVSATQQLLKERKKA
jgi:transketolase